MVMVIQIQIQIQIMIQIKCKYKYKFPIKAVRDRLPSRPLCDPARLGQYLCDITFVILANRFPFSEENIKRQTAFYTLSHFEFFFLRKSNKKWLDHPPSQPNKLMVVSVKRLGHHRLRLIPALGHISFKLTLKHIS